MAALKEALTYYGLIMHRGWRETIDLFDIRKFQTWLTIAGITIGYLLLWLALGAEPALSEIQTWVITIAVPTFGLFILVLLVQLVYAPIRVHHEQIARNEALGRINKELTERLQPRLSIEFHSSQPFEQPTSILDNNGERLPGQWRLYRIGVRCISSSAALDDVSVELARIEPSLIPFLPVPLHQMHDNPPEDQPYERRFRLNPGETKYIDVISIVEGNTTIPYHDHFTFWYAVRDVAGVIPAQPLKLTILAHARDCPPVQKDFVIRQDREHGYRFEPQ